MAQHEPATGGAGTSWIRNSMFIPVVCPVHVIAHSSDI